MTACLTNVTILAQFQYFTHKNVLNIPDRIVVSILYNESKKIGKKLVWFNCKTILNLLRHNRGA